MVSVTPGYTTRGGKFIVDQESAIIEETMEEIISTIPELALIADKIRANLRPLCLHTQELAAFYAKNHPRVLGETTPETTPPTPAKIVPEWTEGQAFPGARVPEDMGCDCSALMNGASDHHPSCPMHRSKWQEIKFGPLTDDDLPPVDYI